MPAQGYAISMLVLLFGLPCLISTMLAPVDPEWSIQTALFIDILTLVFLKLGFVEVCHCFYVSQGFYQNALRNGRDKG